MSLNIRLDKQWAYIKHNPKLVVAIANNWARHQPHLFLTIQHADEDYLQVVRYHPMVLCSWLLVQGFLIREYPLKNPVR